MEWHSAHQIEYLRNQTPETKDFGSGNVNVYTAQIGTDATQTNNVHVLLSADGTRAIILNRLTASTIAQLPLADQQALADMGVFHEVLGAPYALEPGNEFADSAAARTWFQTGIASEMERILPGYDTMTAERTAFANDVSSRGENWELFFIEQLQILYERLDNQAIFHRDNILAAVGDIIDRYDRIKAYRDTTTESVSGPVVFYVNSLDGGASLQSSINILLQAESRIYEATVTAQEVAQTGIYTETLHDGTERQRVLDGPMLLTVMQQLAQTRTEAQSEAEIEAMEQNNRLLEAYSKMQELMNVTLGKFSGLDPDDTRGFMGLSDLTQVTGTDRTALFMFDAYTAQPGVNLLHPRERELGMSRPFVELLDFSDYPNSIGLQSLSKRQWDNFVIDLGEMTKLIGQDTQLRMDAITQMNSEKSRHYDLASNTLNKANQIIRMIVQ